jgi:putative transposase
MPSRLKRYYGANDLHFITCSCYQRRPLLGSPERRDLLLRVLEDVRQRYLLVVHGYVVMPEHIHLLVTEPQVGTISTFMQALKLGFARRVLAPHFSQKAREMGHPRLEKEKLDAAAEESQEDLSRNTRIQRLGPPRSSVQHHVWQKRFYDFNVWTEEKRIEKLRYINRNPVTRGLVASPEEWRWSSFGFYAYRRRGIVRVNEWEVMKMRTRVIS